MLFSTQFYTICFRGLGITLYLNVICHFIVQASGFHKSLIYYLILYYPLLHTLQSSVYIFIFIIAMSRGMATIQVTYLCAIPRGFLPSRYCPSISQLCAPWLLPSVVH